MEPQKRRQEPNTLRTASIVRIFLLFFCWVILTVILYIILNDESSNPLLSDIFLSIGTFGFLPALFIELKRKNINVFRFVSPNKKTEWQLLLVFIPLIIVSIGFSWLLYFIIYKIAPDFLKNSGLLTSNSPLFSSGNNFWHIITTFISMCIIAPLTEEFLFRGIIFDKIRERWTIFAGLVVSSFIFGLLHFDIFGAFFFGIVLCIIYLKTKSLFLPIGIHFLNNFTVLLLILIWPQNEGDNAELNYLFDHLWLKISCVIIGSIWLVWFIYKYYYLPKSSPRAIE